MNRTSSWPPAHRHADPPESWSGDIAALAAALAREVDGEVRTTDGARALYANSGSNYRQVPLAVVVPRTTEALAAGLDVCRRFGAPVLTRGAGTSLAGQVVNRAVLFDQSQYLNRIHWIDPERRLAAVQPGVVLDDLRHAAEAQGVTFGPDPSTHAYCTLGGMIGNNSCGVHSVQAGRTCDNVESLDVVTGDGLRLTVGATTDEEFERIARGGGRRGEIYAALAGLRTRHGDAIRARYPEIPRRVSGYGLPQLLPENGGHVARALVGSEGTCVTVLDAVVNLVPHPRRRVLLVLGFPDIFAAADRVPDVLEGRPIGLEGIDQRLAEAARDQHRHHRALELVPEGKAWLLAEFGGDSTAEAAASAQHLMQRLGGAGAPAMHLFEDHARQHVIWRLREDALGVTAHAGSARPTWEGWEDAAVAPAVLGAYLRDFDHLLSQYGLHGALYGHFGDGCVHTRIDFDFGTDKGRQQFRSFVTDAAGLVVRHGGSFSGEHGDGQARAELLPMMFGDELVQAFRTFKTIWDPEWRLNPGKKVDPNPLDSKLRLGEGYEPAHPATHFSFSRDEGDFARAARRCVGVGLCRSTQDSGTMCPSYRATREEQHSTRGRARLLFEMLRGDTLHGGWREPAVREALDLCLACKACRSECPVQVDMATYKAEFLSHYYEGRLRPRSAYTLGWIRHWAKLASLMPWTARQVTTRPGLRQISRLVAGVSGHRQLPGFARRTFRAQDHRRAPRRGPRVLLWTDTFTNYLLPHTASAAMTVLEEVGGFDVALPPPGLCCGRPLYDFGWLDEAKATLRPVMDALGPEIEQGTPIVFLEPSCASVFRDELPNLFPDDPRASRLASLVRDFAQVLDEQGDRVTWPRLGGRAMVQGHCHQHALGTLDADVRVLERIGLETTLLDAGCCGMAGAFGFEAEHYDVSRAIGEQRLLPTVRDAARDTLIVANGFSCREQIRQETPRRALHLADVLWLAMDGVPAPSPFVESGYLDAAERAERPDRPRGLELGILSTAAVAGGALAYLLADRRAKTGP
ncbi:MAG: FAD-binding and (Fe-S)-binding domain-containing protein [Vicinamibacterales bacterium]